MAALNLASARSVYGKNKSGSKLPHSQTQLSTGIGVAQIKELSRAIFCFARGKFHKTSLTLCSLKKGILHTQAIESLAMLKILAVKNAALAFDGRGHDQCIVPGDAMLSEKLERFPI